MGAGSTSLDAALELTRGTMRDYAALCEHHYKADRPATCTRVLALRHRAASAADRFAGRPPADAKGRVVGVLVESLPALNCLLRDWALGDRKSVV